MENNNNNLLRLSYVTHDIIHRLREDAIFMYHLSFEKLLREWYDAEKSINIKFEYTLFELHVGL